MNYYNNNNNVAASYFCTLPALIPSINMNVTRQQRNGKGALNTTIDNFNESFYCNNKYFYCPACLCGR